MQPPTNKPASAPDVTDSPAASNGGLHQRIVSLLRRHRFKLIAAGLVAMSYCVPKDDPSGLTMCAAAMCAALIDYELQKQANVESSQAAPDVRHSTGVTD